MPKLYYISPYDDENLLYFQDELIILGCSPQQAKSISYSLYNHIRYVCRSFNKSTQYEIPVGDLIDQLSNDDYILPNKFGKYRK